MKKHIGKRAVKFPIQTDDGADFGNGYLHYIGIETYIDEKTFHPFQKMVALVENVSDSRMVRIDPGELTFID
ncbi:hypothetical protein KKH23_06350 [Patescibacteria group bacterium]|uniref:Uncharacterized protein n=1 Tax=viral metagenome TaxID=1070528 RepID=A0A6M3M7I3_9ZZZZ|nr:hypothetical protein [Patescibacteria group bacterium]MBU0846795.1 hypothetical protein [Patescibacteria group bacterium]